MAKVLMNTNPKGTIESIYINVLKFGLRLTVYDGELILEKHGERYKHMEDIDGSHYGWRYY